MKCRETENRVGTETEGTPLWCSRAQKSKIFRKQKNRHFVTGFIKEQNHGSKCEHRASSTELAQSGGV